MNRLGSSRGNPLSRPFIWSVTIVVGLGILAEGRGLLGATRQEWLARRTELDQTIVGPSHPVSHAAQTTNGELPAIRRDPSRQYFYVPPSLFSFDSQEPNSSRQDGTNRTSQDPQQEYATALFTLAGEALADGQADLAFRWLHEVLRFAPQHAVARRILGSGIPRQAPVPRVGRKRHPRFNWQAGRYWQLDTPHFRIATNDSPASALHLAEVLEEFHVVWRQCFFPLWGNPTVLRNAWSGRPLPSPSRARHQVVLFRDREEYLRYLQQIEPRARMTLGYYHAPSRSSYFFQDQDPAISTWRHEATHQLLHECLRARADIATEANVWVVEGIAVYMESLQVCQGYHTLGGLEAERLQYARYRALRGGYCLPLSQLAALGRETLQQDPQIRPLYSQAAGVTHFLMHSQQGELRPALFEYLRSVYEGRTNSDLLETVFQESFPTLDQEYRAFLQVEDQDLQQLDPDTHPTHLSLGQTAITDEGLQHVPDWRSLVWLDLAGTQIRDEGLARLNQAVGLRQLSLEATSIGDATVRHLQGATELQELDLSHTQITDEAMQVVGQLPNLERLWLTGTQVTDAGLQRLSELQNLQTLDLSQTAVTPAAWDAFRRQRPELNAP